MRRAWAKPSGTPEVPAWHSLMKNCQEGAGAQARLWPAASRAVRGLPELTPVCSFRQINNYLTVPAHKLDSPTMSRARIGSGKAGPRVPGEGPGGWALRASQSQWGGQASPLTSS